MNEAYRELAAFALLLAVIGAIVFLAFNKTIDGQAAVAILTSIVTLAGGALAVHTGVKAGADAAKEKRPKG